MFEWIPAISTVTLVAMAAFLARRAIIVRLTRAVAFEFEKKLEVIRADLVAKQAQLEALRSGVLSSVTARHNLLFERRVKAVEELWLAALAMAPAKWLSATLAHVNYEAALQEAERSEKLRDMFALIGKSAENFKSGNSQSCRLFVTADSWAYFSAYQAILSHHSVLRFGLLKAGANLPKVIDTEGVLKIVEMVLPHRAGQIRSQGVGDLHYHLDELEAKLLDSLRAMLSSNDSDNEALVSSAKIIAASEELMRKSEKGR